MRHKFTIIMTIISFQLNHSAHQEIIHTGLYIKRIGKILKAKQLKNYNDNNSNNYLLHHSRTRDCM